MARRFWIGVACAVHVQAGLANGICAFSHGKHEAVARLKAGDRFIYYATKERFENGASTGNPVQAFIASGTVTDFEPRKGTIANGPSWVKDATYDAPFHVPAKSLLEELSFVTSPRHWGMAFRRSLFEVSQADFDLILTRA